MKLGEIPSLPGLIPPPAAPAPVPAGGALAGLWNKVKNVGGTAKDTLGMASYLKENVHPGDWLNSIAQSGRKAIMPTIGGLANAKYGPGSVDVDQNTGVLTKHYGTIATNWMKNNPLATLGIGAGIGGLGMMGINAMRNQQKQQVAGPGGMQAAPFAGREGNTFTKYREA